MLPTGATSTQTTSSADIDLTNLLKALKALKPSELRMALGDVIDDIQDDLAGLHKQMNLMDVDVIRNQMSIKTLDWVTHYHLS